MKHSIQKKFTYTMYIVRCTLQVQAHTDVFSNKNEQLQWNNM